MPVLYPIAPDADAALSAPLGRASREKEARALVGGDVEFVRELAGPAFETREAALAAHARFLDGESRSIAPEDRFCDLVEMAAAPAGQTGGQAEPAFEAGRRWPAPRRLLKTVWRLSVAYWRLAGASRDQPLPQARQARKGGETLDPAALKAMAEQPLKPVKAQQPLDIGLFEVRPPEAPHIIMPDE